MSATQHTPRFTTWFITLHWVFDLLRTLFALRPIPSHQMYQAAYPCWPSSTLWSDIRWGANCPYTQRHLGFFRSRGEAEVAVWEATKLWGQ